MEWVWALLHMRTHEILLQVPGVNWTMRVGTRPPPPRPPIVVQVDVDFDGTIYWDGRPLLDRAQLEAKLREVAVQPEQPELHLRPNKLATYSYVAEVLASAQKLGVIKIGLVGNEQFVQ